MPTTLFWFRNDLRLHDQRALQQAIAHAQSHQQALLLVYVHEPVQDACTQWGFRRMGIHRRRFMADTLQDLQTSLQAQGQRLVLLHGPVAKVLPACARRVDADTVFCEDIAAPEEEAQVQALINARLTVKTLWQSSLIEPDALPFAAEDMPQVFTEFRQRIESARIQPWAPLPAPTRWPVPPNDNLTSLPGWTESPFKLLQAHTANDAHERSNFPYTHDHCRGGETSALAHLQSYLTPPWPDRYKQTRNALQGQHTSSHWSPWLATGAVSARRIWAELQAYEHTHGSNDGTYWLWFELLWRDNFRMLHLQHGPQLYAARGLSNLPKPKHFPKDFQRWLPPASPPTACARSWRATWCTIWPATGVRARPGSNLSWWTLMCAATRATGCMSADAAPIRVWADASTPPSKPRTTTRKGAIGKSGWPDNRFHVPISILG